MAKKKRRKISKKARNAYIATALGLVCLYLGYGYFRAQENLRFVSAVEPIFDESQAVWTSKAFVDKVGTDLDKDDEFYVKMSQISAEALVATQKAKETKTTKALKKEIEDYFTISKSIADNSLKVSGIFTLYGRINADLGKISASPSNPVGDLEKWKAAIDADIKTLSEVEVTPAFRKSRDESVASLAKLSANLGSLVGSIKSKNSDGIKKASAEIEKFDFNVVSPSYREILGDIVTNERFERFQVLDENIQAKIDKVKSQKIVLY